jgi:hypothetical protein
MSDDEPESPKPGEFPPGAVPGPVYYPGAPLERAAADRRAELDRGIAALRAELDDLRLDLARKELTLAKLVEAREALE